MLGLGLAAAGWALWTIVRDLTGMPLGVYYVGCAGIGFAAGHFIQREK